MEVLNGFHSDEELFTIDAIRNNLSSPTGGPSAWRNGTYNNNAASGFLDDWGILHESSDLSVGQRAFATLVISLLIVFISLGNLATIVAVCVYKRLRSVSNLYLASLATADLLVGLPVMTFMLLYTVTLGGHWVFGDTLCDLWTYLDYVACTTSLTNVCAIATDRFVTLAQPLKSIRKRTKKRAARVLAVVWLAPMTFWLVLIITLRVRNGRPQPSSLINHTGGPEQCQLIWKPDVVAIIAVIIVVYVPLLVILMLFVSILCLLKHHMGSMNRYVNTKRRSTTNAAGNNKDIVDSFKDPDDRDVNKTAERAGGISFNPRYSSKPECNNIEEEEEENEDHTIPLDTLRGNRRSCPDFGQHKLVSTAVGPDAQSMCMDISDANEELYILRGRRFRTVGTSTSPERFGLVRTIGTNTSPSLNSCRNMSDSMTSISGDARNVSHTLIPASVLMSTTTVTTMTPGPFSTGLGASSFPQQQQSDLDESDTDTIKTISTCSGTSSTTTTSRDLDSSRGTYSSELSLVRLRLKMRRHYASLLRSERESSLERTRLRQQIRAARILGTIMVFLVLCWMPFAVLWPLRTYCPDCVPRRLFELSVWTNYINSGINPIIYCMYNPSFRRAFKKLFLQWCSCRIICRRPRHER